MITEYETISEPSLDRLDDAVNRAILLGWQPIGGVAVTVVIANNRNITRCMQAMVKYGQ